MQADLRNIRVDEFDGWACPSYTMILVEVEINGKEAGEYAEYVTDGELEYRDRNDNSAFFAQTGLTGEEDAALEEHIRSALAGCLADPEWT